MKALLVNAKAGGSKSSHPQCKVCGDESSGFHYGVDSCEGCKGFFRRCITQGMTHKCANEERCEITAFTRNSCQFCRLKKCFEVGMAREASRLGRRPKRLKEVSGETSRSHNVNLTPIAPYPSPKELYSLKMAELQKLLLSNGADKSELIQAFLAAAQNSFREHSKSGGSFGRTNNSSSTTTTTSTGNASSSTIGMTTGASNMPMLQADINLNMSPNSMGLGGGTNNATLTSGGTPGDILNAASPASSIQAPSPFPDLSTADLSPLPPGLNLNMGAIFDNSKKFNNQQGGNLNGNSMYTTNQSLMDNNMPSPLILPNVDNLDPCSPSTFLMGNADFMASPEQLSSSPGNNMNATYSNNNMMMMGQGQMDSKANLNINTNLMMGQQQGSMSPSMISPNAVIKQEVTDPTGYEQERGESSSCLFPSSELLATYDNLCDVDRVLAEAKSTPNEARLLLLNQVTDVVVEAHLGTTINTYNNVAAAKRRIDGNLNADINDMPDISKLSLSASELWHQFLKSLVPEITKVVKFSKKLPGFSDVSQEDQIKLIKQGTFEVMVARYTVLVDEKNELMLDPQLQMISPRNVISEMPMGPFLDEFFNIAKQFNPLKLTDGEIGLFTSILMMNPDREGLEHKKSIKLIQDLFLQALYCQMKLNHTDYEKTFSELINTVRVFRKVNEDHAKFLNSIKMKSPSDFEKQFPPLHKELME